MLRGGPGDIPLVHTLYDIYVLWNTVITKFPKTQRYTLGETCSRYLLDVLELVLAASSTNNLVTKTDKLKLASPKIDTLKLLIRLCKDCDCLTNQQYLKTESMILETGKQLGAWLRDI
ncbi:TPA: hypothetical protein DEP96_01035 [Candidatus Uhrbacteria bacterium]|nr:hypothetical protein [Candidatus Uhrbacteria bacterium]